MSNFISMKKGITLMAMTFITIALHCQHTVSKRWDARFGGTNFDFIQSIDQTRNGEFVIAGNSYSNHSGNKTQNLKGETDYWLIRIDGDGHYIWDRDYGGTANNDLYVIKATTDGGFILGGTSGSGMGADKTQISRGGLDMWVVRLDSLGNKLWDKSFGGSRDDGLESLKQTKDGGFILAGGSSSGISGDKSQPNRDPNGLNADYWIVKIDSLGNKQWDKTFGSEDYEGAMDIIQTPDGGYLIGGSSPSYYANGDKSQPNFAQVTQNYWVVKVDSVGNKQWDKVFGGVNGELLSTCLNTSDGNYMLGGNSYSAVSGNKTTAICGYWLVKIDTAGIKLGDWSYGSGLGTGSGMCGEKFSNMSNTSDGGYILTGSHGHAWTVKIDSRMHQVWDKETLSFSASWQISDVSIGALQTSSNCYLVGIQTAAGIGGDKSQAAWDSSADYWVVQYCDTVLTGITETVGDIHFSIYPNPTAGEISITLERDNLKEAAFTLTNISGQLIYQSTETNLARSYTKMLDIHALPAGVYVLEIVVDGQRISRRVVKE